MQQPPVQPPAPAELLAAVKIIASSSGSIPDPNFHIAEKIFTAATAAGNVAYIDTALQLVQDPALEFFGWLILEAFAQRHWEKLREVEQQSFRDFVYSSLETAPSDNYIVLQKAASVVAAVAAHVWPEQWSDLVTRLVAIATRNAQVGVQFALQTLHLLADVISGDEVGPKRKRELVQAFETEWGNVIILFRLAKENFLHTHQYALIESVAAVSGIFSAEQLLDCHVDELAVYFSTQAGAGAASLKGAVLNLLEKITFAVGKRKGSISNENLRRFVHLISEHAATCDTAALRLCKTLIAKFPDSTALKENDFLAMWETAVVQPLCHPALGVASLGAVIGQLLLAKYSTALRGIDLYNFVKLMIIRAFRVGEPAVMELLNWQPLEAVDSVAVAFGGEHLVNWSSRVAMATAAELEEEEDKAAGFSAKAAELKASLGVCAALLWQEYESTAEIWAKLLNEVQTLPIYSSPKFWDFAVYDGTMAERLRALVTPAYVVLDGFLVLLEAAGQKVKTAILDAKKEVTTASRSGTQAAATALLSLNFPATRCTYIMENRRMETISVCGHLWTVCEVSPATLLEFIMSRVTLDVPSNDALVVFSSGRVETWQDQAYMIRRRALYALMSCCHNTAYRDLLPKGLPVLMERYSSDKTPEVEKALLKEALVAVVGVIGSFEQQTEVAERLCENVVIALQSPLLLKAAASQEGMVECIFGDAQTLESQNTADAKAEDRRFLARTLTHFEAVLKRTEVPTDPKVLQSGGYACNAVGAIVGADGQTYNVRWPVQNPLTKIVATLFPQLLAILLRFQGCWSAGAVAACPWLKSLLTPGDEELKSYEGQAAVTGAGKNRAQLLFRSPDACIPEQYLLLKRHTFNIRTVLYRTFGALAQAGPGFYGHPCFLEAMESLTRKSLNDLSVAHLGVQLDLLWRRVVAGLSSIVEGNYPVIPFIANVIAPFFNGAVLKMEVELQNLKQLRETLDQNNEKDSQLYTLRTHMVSQCADVVNHILSDLLAMKSVAGETSNKEQMNLALKTALYNSETALGVLLGGVLLRLCVFPYPAVMTDALQCLARYARQSTKNFQPPSEATLTVIGAVFEGVLVDVAGASIAFDPAALAAGDSKVGTPLQTFLHSKPSGFVTHTAALLYELLRSLVRIHRYRCAKMGTEANGVESIVLTPQLHHAVSLLNKLVPELDQFVLELLKDKGQHDVGSCKVFMRSAVETLRQGGEAQPIVFIRNDEMQRLLTRGTSTDTFLNGNTSLSLLFNE